MSDEGPVHLRGLALYRLGRTQEALDVLLGLEAQIKPLKRGPHPSDLPIIAMAYHRLGREAEARDVLDRLGEVLARTGWPPDGKSEPLRKEAEAMIRPGGSWPPASKP